MKEIDRISKLTGNLTDFSTLKFSARKIFWIRSSFSGIILSLILLISMAMVPGNDSKNGNHNPVLKGTQTTSTVINTDNSELPSNQVNAIYIDSLNIKWIGTDAGLALFKDSTWTIYSINDHLRSNKVNDIDFEYSQYGGKEMWIATDTGLTVAGYDIDGITSATTYVEANSGLVDNKVNAVCVDTLHNRWVATDSALSVFKGSDWGSTLYGLDAGNDSFKLAEYKITDLRAFNKENYVFAATSGKGIMRYLNDDVDGITGASSYSTPWAQMESDNILAMDIKGTLQWYGSDLGASKHTMSFTKNGWYTYNVDSGMLSNMVTSVYIDKENNVWLGTSEGLSIFTSGEEWYKYTSTEGLIDNHINCITSDINGNVWIGTSAGIEWFDGIPGVKVDVKDAISTPTFDVPNSSVVFPNPVKDKLIVLTNLERSQNVQVLVYSLAGQLVSILYEGTISSGKNTLPLEVTDSKFVPGTYMLKIKGRYFENSVKINKL
jgi:ligand-binding sensor domain-containing protein